jgi:hypothetical protein
MPRSRTFLRFIVLAGAIYLMGAFVTLPAYAACPAGTVLADVTTTLSTPKTASDGAGGSYVVWLNTLGISSFQLLALRVDLSGRVVSGWPTGGIPVTSQSVFAEDAYNICVDSNGRLVIVWAANVAGAPKTYAQRINSAGTLEWGDGMSVFSTAYSENHPVIAADEIGGCFIAAEVSLPLPAGEDIYVQRIDEAGATWGPGGRVACNAIYDQYQPSIADIGYSYGKTYAAIAWTDRRNRDDDIYAQCVDSNGVLQWGAGASGLPVAVASGRQFNPVVGHGNNRNNLVDAYFIWSDQRRGIAGTADMYIQHLWDNGAPVWAVNGLEVAAKNGYFQVPIAVVRAPDGATFTWYAGNVSESQFAILGQRRWDFGDIKLPWADGGTTIAGPIGQKGSFSAVGDGAGGFAMSWRDLRSGNYDVYATRFTADAVPASGWTAQGTAMGLGVDDQTETGVALLTGGGLFVGWSYAGDIYEQATNSTAAIVTIPPVPKNVAATDCTGNGVTVTWSDVCGDEYRVYRDDTQIATLSANATTYFDPNDQPTSPPPGNYNYCVRSYRASGGLSDAGCHMGCMPPPLHILSPNGGESWPPGSYQTIQWAGPSDPVAIQLFVDGAPSGGSMQGVSTTLATGATGGSYSFIVPDVATTRARVQITQVANGATKYVYSSNPFTMATPPPPNTWSYLRVDAPDHGWNQSDMCANGSGGVYAVYLDYLGGGDLRFASRASYTSPWILTVAKSVGDVGSWPSIVRDSNGIVHIAYYDYTVGGANLYYTSGNPAISSPSSWPQELVSNISVVQGDCSIAVDDQNVPYIAFNTGDAGGWKLRVFKRQSDGTWANFGNWFNEDIQWPNHITLKFAGNNQFWVACTDQQTSSRLNLWKYNSIQWVKLDLTNAVPGPYTDVSLILDAVGRPYLAYTVPSNGGQNLIFQPWGGDVMGTPVTVDPTLGTISSVSLQNGPNYPRIGYVGNGVVKQATGVYSATQLPCGWTRQVVDATGNMDSQVSLVVQWNDERWYLYRNLTTQTMSSAGPYYSAGGGGGGGGGGRRESVKPFSIADEASGPPRVVVSGGLGSAPLHFRFEGMRKNQPVRVDIFDVRGRLVQTLSGHDMELTWNRVGRGGDRVASGIVLYRAVAGGLAFTGKMVLTQ